MVAFSSRARILGECSTIHSPPTRFLYFLWVEISLCTLIPLFTPGLVHSGSASWDDCYRVFPDELRVSSFLDRFPHYAWTVPYSAHSNFIGSRVYTCVGVTCHLHFWQNDWGLLHATAVTQGWDRHRIRVSTQSWLWTRKFSHHSCRDLNLQPFDYKSSALTNKLPRLPYLCVYCHTDTCSVTQHTDTCAPTWEISTIEFVMSWRLLSLKVTLTWDSNTTDFSL